MHSYITASSEIMLEYITANVNITHTSDIAEDKDGYVYFLNAAVKCASANVVYNLENLCKYQFL